MAETNPEAKAGPSKVEAIKIESQGLAGKIAETLVNGTTHLEEDDNILLKHHGSYQQDDRDQRAARRQQKQDKAWMFMVRCKIPGGRVTTEQYLALDDIAGTTANGSLRLTSRQGIQFHGIGIENLKQSIRRINDTRLTTLGACGDVNRNVMCCSVSDLDGRSRLGMEKLCADLAAYFAPSSTAYWEIWCDGEKWGEPITPNREEPLYGTAYLPRKFKMAVATPEDNCVDLYTQDLGFEAVHQAGELLAYDLIVGGGLGFTHGQTTTYPRLGTRFLRVRPEEALEVAEAIVLIQRDWGDRSNRKHARLKYLVEDRGLDWLRSELFSRLGRQLPDAGPVPTYQMHLHLGWNEAPDGSLYVGIHLANGRVIDVPGGASIRTGLREIITRFRPQIRITPRQDVILAGLAPTDRAEVERLMQDHGLPAAEDVPALRRLAMACVALPTCPLALAESERYIPKLLTELESLGVGDAPVEIRMTGCPNSCVRTSLAEIGIVGRGARKYAIYLGGNPEGTRLAFLFKETVEDVGLAPIIRSLIDAWQQQTQGSPSFGDWAALHGAEALAQLNMQEDPPHDASIPSPRGPLHD